MGHAEGWGVVEGEFASIYSCMPAPLSGTTTAKYVCSLLHLYLLVIYYNWYKLYFFRMLPINIK